LAGAKGFVLFFSLFAAVCIFLRHSAAKIEGVTGDTIGAASEIAETLALLGAAVFIS